MRFSIFILVSFYLMACREENKNSAPEVNLKKPVNAGVLTDSNIVVSSIKDFSDPLIINRSGYQVDLLLNGINNYFGGKQVPGIYFHSEFMGGLFFEETDGGLLFGKQLLIDSNGVQYHKKKLGVDGRPIAFKARSPDFENRVKKFRLKEARGILTFQGVSCNDADFNQVKLSFGSEELIIDSLINASVFEYDLDKDGEEEPFVCGVRRCSQEMVLLRITKKRE